jgi:hypothetical protein
MLYEQYLADPLRMLTPEEMLEDDGLTRQTLATNSHYLHDRGYIEMLTGYNPPLFAAARISPQGIDLIENAERFRELFGQDAPVVDAVNVQGPRLVLNVAEAVEALGISDVRKQWLLDDLRRLRDEFRKEPQERREDVVRACLRAVAEYFDEDPAVALPSFGTLVQYLSTGE